MDIHSGQHQATGAKSRVLLVEDDAWIRAFLRDILSDEGYSVSEAADGRTGVRLGQETRPDLIVLDLAMPEFTGVDVLRELRRHARTRTIPVLILSAYAQALPVPEVEHVAAVLNKPLQIPELLDAVESALRPGTGEESLIQTAP